MGAEPRDATPPPAADSPVDGRAARRDRNRDAVLDAVIALFQEGHLRIDPDAVAARTGLSARSVYRYFADRDELLRAALDRHAARYGHLGRIRRFGEGTLAERIDALLESRLAVHEAVGATARSARALALSNGIHRERGDRTRAGFRAQIERQFAPELRALPPARRRAVSASVDVLTQLESLDLLRDHRGLSVAETRRVLADALRALLT